MQQSDSEKLLSKKQDLREIWLVKRSDDNGNEFVILKTASESEAKEAVDDFTKRGHKQYYWYEKVRL